MIIKCHECKCVVENAKIEVGGKMVFEVNDESPHSGAGGFSLYVERTEEQWFTASLRQHGRFEVASASAHSLTILVAMFTGARMVSKLTPQYQSVALMLAELNNGALRCSCGSEWCTVEAE